MPTTPTIQHIRSDTDQDQTGRFVEGYRVTWSLGPHGPFMEFFPGAMPDAIAIRQAIDEKVAALRPLLPEG